jgi:hypothetical protein
VVCVKVTAVGLIRVPADLPPPDRWWYRAIVVRQAHDQRLSLVDVFELRDDRQEDVQELQRLAATAAQTDAAVLVTYGVRPDLARMLSEKLGLRHLPSPDRPGVPSQGQPGAFGRRPATGCDGPVPRPQG